jgi:hypothetical protein
MLDALPTRDVKYTELRRFLQDNHRLFIYEDEVRAVVVAEQNTVADDEEE